MQRPSFSIYDASAGSGKTYALVKEYLKIILTATKNDAYKNILAITFTNKAVHEMKSRIVGSLSEFAKDDPNSKAANLMLDLVTGKRKENNPDEWDEEPIGLSLNQIKAKSQQIIKHIIHNYAAFDISTIDKFTHKVIRAFAHDLNLPMTFEVTLETENLLIEAVDALIAKAGEDQILTKLLVDFAMEKTDEDKSWDISREILMVGKLTMNENNREEISHFKNKTISEFVTIKNRIIDIRNELEQVTVTLANDIFASFEKNAIDVSSFSAGHFPNHIATIQKKKFNPGNKKYYESTDVRINKAAKDRETIEAILPELLDLLNSAYAIFERIAFYNAVLKNSTPLSLLNTVSNELESIQKEKNILSISEFNAIIHREIQNQPAPFIYERLGERYRHFFIDEFQDTSEMQWQNLIPLIDNALSGEVDGEKGTLLIVGDPKQSIYRWRGGKAEQFIELSKDENPFKNPDKVGVTLDTNYRSYSQIIDFNNTFFKLMSAEFEREEYKNLYENHSFQKYNSKTGGLVSLSFIPQLEKSEEGVDAAKEKSVAYVKATLATIHEIIQQGFDYKDIAILTRKRSQGIAIATYLTEQNIPILSSETLLIQNAMEVRFIIHLLTYLNNSKDDESKAYFLQYVAENCQNMLETHDFISQGMLKTEEHQFEKWLAGFGITMSFENSRKKSLYELVEIIISKFSPKTASASTDNQSGAYVQYFLDIVLERDMKSQAGISDFLSYWNTNASKFSIPSPEGKNAVRILTIHKSKGLEFPVVIMPFAEEDYSKKIKDKLWIPVDETIFGLPKVLIDNTNAVADFGEAAAGVFAEKKQEELLDNINILYVALTRAEEQLHIISRLVEPNKEGVYPNDMASYFIKYLIECQSFDPNQSNYKFGNAARLSVRKEEKDTNQVIENVQGARNLNTIKIAQKEAMMWGTVQQEAIAYGNTIHEILSMIYYPSDIDFALANAIEKGLITEKQKAIVCKTLNEIVDHPELTYCFSSENKVLNEQTIIQKEGTVSKPDRMVFGKNKEVFLIDYKTGEHQSKYQNQLENYQKAIEQMGYQVVKKTLVYIGERINVVNL